MQAAAIEWFIADSSILLTIGAGYTYTANSWSVGIKLMAGFTLDILFIGIDGNATYWFKNNIGITGAVTPLFSVPFEVGFYPVKLGISMRF